MTFSTRILRFVTRKGEVTNAQVAKFIGRNSSFAWQELNRLVRRGLLTKGVLEDGTHTYLLPEEKALTHAMVHNTVPRVQPEAPRPDAGAL